jgi:hypothetical protein
MFSVTGQLRDGSPKLHPKCKPCQNTYLQAWRVEKMKELDTLTCIREGCERTRYVAKDLCRPHYDKDRRATMERRCVIPGCGKTHSSRGYCSTHLSRFQRYGDPGGLELRRAPSGQGHVNSDGYRKIYVNGKTIFEHRVIMEKILGRPLLATENVHHINGHRLDNRAANLELWSTMQPSGQRVADKLAWAREFLALYDGTLFDPSFTPDVDDPAGRSPVPRKLRQRYRPERHEGTSTSALQARLEA